MAGSALLVGSAGLYLVYAGLKDVPLIDGLRSIMRGKVPSGTRHDPFTPEELSAFANVASAAGAIAAGRVPGGTIVSVYGIRVNQNIARRVEAMITAAKRDGVTLRGGGYRSSIEQAALRKAHCCGDPSSSKCSCGPATAPVGSSRHETGEAIDFRNAGGSITRGSKEFQWLAANASRYGLYNLPSEPWHWSTDGK